MTPAAFPHPFGAPDPRPQSLTVFVRGLELQAGIGVHDHEHGRLQTLIMDVELHLAPTGVTHLADTINYETVAEAAQAIVAQGHVGLVETFAERLAVACMADQRVMAVRVRIEKPGALGGAASPGCVVAYGR